MKLTIATKLWLPSAILGVVVVLMTSASAVRTSHLQAAAKEAQESQQSKLELSLRWAGLTETAAIAAVALNKLPIAIVTVREGARSLDHALDDMAQVFRMGVWRRLRHVILPQLAPYLAAAARSGLSLVWKIVLIVELLGRPNGVGFEIGVAFQLFDVTRILAYALAFIAVMLGIETFLVQPLERYVARWRPRPA